MLSSSRSPTSWSPNVFDRTSSRSLSANAGDTFGTVGSSPSRSWIVLVVAGRRAGPGISPERLRSKKPGSLRLCSSARSALRCAAISLRKSKRPCRNTLKFTSSGLVVFSSCRAGIKRSSGNLFWISESRFANCAFNVLMLRLIATRSSMASDGAVTRATIVGTSDST